MSLSHMQRNCLECLNTDAHRTTRVLDARTCGDSTGTLVLTTGTLHESVLNVRTQTMVSQGLSVADLRLESVILLSLRAAMDRFAGDWPPQMTKKCRTSGKIIRSDHFNM